ncbi:GFA family protein [Thalassotalea piscium]
MKKQINGSCLCGQVTCTLEGPFNVFYQCYCDRCQKKTGSAFASLIFSEPEKITWHTGLDLIKRFDLPNAERFSNSFCSCCGSQVPYLSRDGAKLAIPAGFITGDPEIVPSANIFWDERSCWYEQGQAAPSFSRYPE